jgi:hypothetical protein
MGCCANDDDDDNDDITHTIVLNLFNLHSVY